MHRYVGTTIMPVFCIKKTKTKKMIVSTDRKFPTNGCFSRHIKKWLLICLPCYCTLAGLWKGVETPLKYPFFRICRYICLCFAVQVKSLSEERAFWVYSTMAMFKNLRWKGFLGFNIFFYYHSFLQYSLLCLLIKLLSR